ncbi:MAG: sigma 54-interacting transcriptional regulator [Deltaproteobacteria bacterium]|nr:sigma 54-interacting transcriptional regulator [Deltaproteobacteria bacterium]
MQRTREPSEVLDNIPGLIVILTADGTLEFINRLVQEYFGLTLEQLKGWVTSDAIHPDDLSNTISTLRRAIQTGQPYQLDHRLRRFDGAYRWFHDDGQPVRDADGRIVNWYVLFTDIHERKTAEERLRERGGELASVIDTIPGLVMTATAEGEVEFVNQGTLEYFGRTLEELKGWTVGDSVHPDDLVYALPEWRRCVETGERLDLDNRCRRADGEYRWFHSSALPLHDADGRVARWYVLLTDIHERKTAEEELRRREESLHEAQKLSHTGSWKYVLSGPITLTPEMGRIFGVDSGDHTSGTEYFFNRFHPEDRKRVENLFQRSVKQKTDFQADYRIVLPDGAIRHLHTVGHPVVKESGELIEFFGTTVDVTEHWEARAELERALAEIKRLRDRLQDENLALREEIIRSSMFEEIVGSSQPLRRVLDQVARVAPTDSTVLISGETGTGKELIARAIHRRSNRSARAFISVNCGAIPQSLIASELFGYEKGAFTGAQQRRIGRFEAADGGTIFLDEVGELPMETQVALLRVLQEREFERIGSSEPLKLNVRILAATNRDLQAAVSARTFRQDLFYRLNVFPIEMPPLRERADDIRLLTEYLIDRYAKQAGKRFNNITSNTLELFQIYRWPGNVRELQNVIERAVVLCDEPTFSVDESWLRQEPTAVFNSAISGLGVSIDNERELIEVALAECHGRVSGPSGASAKLGIPRQTLESKILRLGINKYRFRT